MFYFLDKFELTDDFSEIKRYLGYGRANTVDEATQNLFSKAVTEMNPVLKPQAVFETFELSHNPISFSNVKIDSKDLEKNLEGCSRITIFAATIGSQADHLIKKYTKLDTAYATVLQATGAMYIEQFVGKLNDSITEKEKTIGFQTRPRYSPGFGDVPLSVQKDFFRLLPCSKIGLTLMDSLTMAPEKSVTAFIGSRKL